MTTTVDPGDNDSRLAEIEAKLTLSEDLLDTLNRTVYQQQQHIDQLERDLRILREQVEACSITDPNATQEELPPHY